MEKSLTKKYPKIRDGEKGKFIYLNVPNTVNSDVISFVTTIPKEFGVDKYLNKEKMFEKIIIDPVKNILEPIGWSVEKKLTLDAFFG